MKKINIIIVLLLMITNFSKAQDISLENVFMMEAYSKDGKVYIEPISKNLIISDELYSNQKLVEGVVTEENEKQLKFLNEENSSYKYLLNIVYSKDSITNTYKREKLIIYNPNNFLKNKYNEIEFRDFSLSSFKYDCKNSVYDDLIYRKRINFNDKILVSKGANNNKYCLKIIGSNCSEITSKTFELNTQYFEIDEMLVLYSDKKITLFYGKPR